ncbi:hypothetical protein CWO07_19830 [Vibrio splendidus]|uniref:Uncharacterized protein n=1 Tax=Vibrio splendidus TaxID=29497 RepID=A0A2T5ER63_VIBSP|nr:hypothetical protein CWO07_19830 [Vibrio splendidus]
MSILRPAMCGIVSATHGNIVAKVAHLKSGTRQQPATVVSHFYYVKDEHNLRARDKSLDSNHALPLWRLA